jgi:putative DNA primase/helicase
MSHSITPSASNDAQTSTGTLPACDAPVSIHRIEVASTQPTPTTPTTGNADPQSTVVSNTEEFTVGQFTADIAAAAKSPNSYHEARLDFSAGEIGHAQRFVNQWGETTRYDSDRGQWMTWQQNHWESDGNGEAVHRMTKVAESILKSEVPALRACIAEYGDKYYLQAKKVQEQGEKLHKLNVMVASLGIAKVLPEMRTKTSQYDANPMRFNCLSGVIDLPTGHLLPHDPEDMHSRIAPVELGPVGSECPRWMQFLSDIMCGDAELVAYVQRVVGYIMTGSVKEQCFFILYGGGSNGKSTFINVIYHLLGGYAYNVDIRTFMDIDRGNAPRNDLAALVGMRFAVSPEWKLGQALDEAILKTFSGGDLVSARFLNKEMFQFNPVCKIVLASNHKPIVRGTDNGIWRRMRLVPFLATFDKSKEIKDYDKLMIAEEGPAILRWAMEGAQIWAREGLCTPSTISEATNEYRGSQDWFQSFLEERCEVEATASVASQSIYNDYRTWCGAAGINHPVKLSVFNERLQGHKFHKKATKVANMWMGLKLKFGPQFVTEIPSSDAMLVQHQPSHGDSKVGGDLTFGL